MPYCPECGRYHTPDTGGCRFQTTIATPVTQEQGQTRVWFKPDSPLKTVPMVMLRDVYEYGCRGGRLGKITLCGIISRYGYTVTEDKEEGR